MPPSFALKSSQWVTPLALSKIIVEKTQLTIKAADMESQLRFSIYLDKMMPPYAKKEPRLKRFNSSAGARETPGYKPIIWNIRIKTGRYGQYVTNDLKLIKPLSSIAIQKTIFIQKKPHPIDSITPNISENIKAVDVKAELVLLYLVRNQTSNSERLMDK
jgi:hypothetical protein